MSAIFDTLPPVGSRVSLEASRETHCQMSYPGYHTLFVQSGTMALAAAMELAKTASTDSCSRCEVVLPAYACPDLISAAIYVGLKPVLVDLERDRPQLSLSALSERIGANTLAVVAVNFLGLPERCEALHELCHRNGSYLIEDNAQSFPLPQSELHGDYVITSFGRGKPVSILGGGMLLVREGLSAAVAVEGDVTDSATRHAFAARFMHFAKAQVYNTLLSPRCYGLFTLLPFLSLGETRYKPLHSIEAMPEYLSQLLPANINNYLSASLSVQQKISSMLAESDTVVDLPASVEGVGIGGLAEKRLLRYPILVSSLAARDALLNELNSKGLGATAMYKKPLLEIEGVQGLVETVSDLPNAKDFANRLITLPVHAFVEERHIEKMAAVFDTFSY